jgi:amidase
MAIDTELAALDATAQAELIRAGQISVEECCEAAIARIERLNPQLNAVITPLYDAARAAIRAGLPEGPFHGVPFLLKDLMAAYAGSRMCFGTRMIDAVVADHDGELTARYKRAGLVILGKTNVPEFGIVPTTEPIRFGPTRNPWNPQHSTGGSSGGSAAAVASGMVPFAHGNDGGGSIRIPASCCGLFGMKPTRGRIPQGPDVGDLMGGLVSEHALTRSVRDSAALLDACDGPELGDPYCAPHKQRPYLDEVGSPPGKLRIAFTTAAPTGVPVHEECAKAASDAAKLCAELGHEVEETFPQLDAEAITQPFLTVFNMGPVFSIDALMQSTNARPTAENLEPLTLAMYQMARNTSASDYLLAWARLQQASRAMAQFMTDYDVIITPTLAQPPMPIGAFDAAPDNPFGPLALAGAYAAFTPMCNFTGQPAMSMPLHWTPEGLPVGVQFVGRFGGEATLFRLAAQIEEAAPWRHRKPPVFA